MDYAYKPTTHGRAAMAACMSLEKPLKITRVAFGSGKVDEGVNLADVHELLEYVSDGAVADRRHEDDRFCLTVQYANSAHPEVKMFMLSEFIVYVEDPETGEDADLLYGTLGDYRQPVPASNPAYPPSVFNFPLELILSDEINVSVAAPAGLVTHNELITVIRRHDENGEAHPDIRRSIENLRRQLSGTIRAEQIELTIPVTGWVPDEDTGGEYPLHTDIAKENVTEDLVPMLTVLPGSLAAAGECGMGSTARTLDGILRVYAQTAPTAPISTRLILLDTGPSDGSGGYMIPAASAYTLGGVKVRSGSGLTIDEEGNLAIDAADSGAVEELFHDSKG